MSEPRPLGHLRDWKARYPEAWDQLSKFRSERGKGLMKWPDWCYVPVAGAFAAVSAVYGKNAITPNVAPDIAVISALGAWRMTRGIYRFDATVLDGLWDTPMDGDIPIEVLYRLPEWCVYIELERSIPALGHLGSLHGFYAQLEYDANTYDSELRLLFDLEAALLPLPILLKEASLQRAMESLDREANDYERQYGGPPDQIRLPPTQMAAIAAPFVSLVLYLCSVNAEIRDASGTQRHPENPHPKRVKRRSKLFPASSPTTWEVAYRLGARLRAAGRDADGIETGTHASPRAHIRRSHWHSYWTGQVDSAERKTVLKWLPPIPVNVDDDEGLPAVIKPVG
jgi:hypothetical protein